MFLAVLLFVICVRDGRATVAAGLGEPLQRVQQRSHRLESIAAGLRNSGCDEEAASMVRREEVLSGIKWLDRCCREFDLARRCACCCTRRT